MNYIEGKAPPPPGINCRAFCPRKPEAVRKTTPELLPAVLRNIVGCLCVLYFTRIFCTMYRLFRGKLHTPHKKFSILPLEHCDSCSCFLGQKARQIMMGGGGGALSSIRVYILLENVSPLPPKIIFFPEE